MIENPYMILFVLKNIVHAINEKYLSDITSKCILSSDQPSSIPIPLMLSTEPCY